MKRICAFSMIELLITIAIVGILGGIAVPYYMNYKAEARRGESYHFLPEILRAQQEYRIENDVFTDDITDLVFDEPESSTFYRYILCDNEAAANIYGSGDRLGAANTPDPADVDWSHNTSAACGTASGFTAHANGNIDDDNTLDNVNMSEEGELCTPDLCGAVTSGGGVAGVSYVDDVNN